MDKAVYCEAVVEHTDINHKIIRYITVGNLGAERLQEEEKLTKAGITSSNINEANLWTGSFFKQKPESTKCVIIRGAALSCKRIWTHNKDNYVIK